MKPSYALTSTEAWMLVNRGLMKYPQKMPEPVQSVRMKKYRAQDPEARREANRRHQAAWRELKRRLNEH